MCVHVYSHVCALCEVWKSTPNIIFEKQLLPPFFWVRNSTELKFTNSLARMDDQKVPGIFPPLPFQCWGHRCKQSSLLSFSTWCWRTNQILKSLNEPPPQALPQPPSIPSPTLIIQRGRRLAAWQLCPPLFSMGNAVPRNQDYLIQTSWKTERHSYQPEICPPAYPFCHHNRTVEIY